MIFLLYSFLALLFIGLYNLLGKNISFIDRAIIFMIISMLFMNLTTILGLNVKLISFTENKERFLAFILVRNVIVPLLVLYFLHFFRKEKTLFIRLIVFVLTIFIFTLLEYLGLKTDLYVYEKWSVFLSVGMFILTLLGSLGLKLVLSRIRGDHFERI